MRLARHLRFAAGSCFAALAITLTAYADNTMKVLADVAALPAGPSGRVTVSAAQHRAAAAAAVAAAATVDKDEKQAACELQALVATVAVV